MDEDVWMLEERLWLEGLNVYQDVLDPACLMAFPATAPGGPDPQGMKLVVLCCRASSAPRSAVCRPVKPRRVMMG
jgi:hypothetical protein